MSEETANTDGTGDASGGPSAEAPVPTAATSSNDAQKEATVAPGQFRVGGVLSKSFSVYFRNFLPFVLLAVIVLSPNLIYVVIGGADLQTALSEQKSTLLPSAMMILSFLLGFLLTAAVTYGTYQDLRGRS